MVILEYLCDFYFKILIVFYSYEVYDSWYNYRNDKIDIL